MRTYIQDSNGKMRGSLPSPSLAPTAAPSVPAAPAPAAPSAVPSPVESAHARYRRALGAAPSITRAEGYQRGRAKEEAGLQLAETFLARLLGIPADQITRIDGADDNYRYGDLRLPSGKTIEVKRQPINPDRYPLNFVEVAEITFNPRHRHGTGMLAQALGIDVDRLSRAQVRDYRHDGHPESALGRPEHLSVSITSMLASTATMYVNPDDGHVYVYRSEEIIDHIKRGVLNDNLRRGQGNSNDDGLAVLVPLPRWRFHRGTDGLWRYTGTGTAEAEKTLLRTRLS